MMVDWLIVWGAVEAAGILVKPVLEDLAKDSAKDYARDFFKDCFRKVIRLPEKDVQKEAYGKALKEFLELVQQELENVGYQAAQVKQYIQPFKQFVGNGQVAALLGQAFESECRTLDTRVLAQTWRDLNLPYLPDDFDWDLVSKLYVRKVKAIVQHSDALRPIFAAEAQAAAAESLQELAGIAPAFDLGCYAEGLREQYGNLKLESLDTTGVYYNELKYNELKLWKVFVPQNVRECQEFLPQVYEIPKDHLRRLRERGELSEAELAEAELEKHRRVYAEQPIRSVLEVVGDPTIPVGAKGRSPLPHVVILGDPGSGKSSLLQYLALIWAERPLSELPLYPIPLLIELRTYARDKREKKCSDILSFIHSGNIVGRLNQQHLHEKLKTGHAIALFDGVDEVFDPALRDEVVMDIHRFTNEYPEVQAIATSRWLGYKAHQLRNAGFRHFMLQDLEPEQIEEFIQRWHNLTFPIGLDKTRKQERLHKAIQESKAIQELAGNPLLLTMMAILNRNQELPRDRPELYNQASRVLLHQWDVERNLIEHRLDPLTIDYRDKQAMLRQVAHHMQSSEKGLAGNIISATDLENILVDYLKTLEIEQPRTVARLMINQLRTRNFILCYLGADSYAFVHRTFLEYFCAWEFVWQFKETQTLTFAQLKQEAFQHWQDETWHEVLRLIAGMIDAKFVAELIDYLLEQKVDRGAFLDEGNRQKKEGLSNLVLATNCFAEVRNKAAIAPTSAQLLETLQHELEQEYPYQLDSEAALVLTTLIATLWQENAETLPWLKDCLRRDSFSCVPEAAVQSIAQIWKDDPNTLLWLKNCAQHDKNEYVRRAAVETLVQGWKEDPDTLPILIDRIQYDGNRSVLYTAVQALAQSWKDDPSILTWLKDCVQHDEDDGLRYAAIQALVQGWKDDPDILPILKDRAHHDKNWDVRYAAVQALVQGWKDDPDILPILKDRAQYDENWDVKYAAMEALVQGWKDDLDILHWFRNHAQQNKNWTVRCVAMEVLAQGWRDNSDTLLILKDRVQYDENGIVRCAAVQALAQGWKDDPDTLPMLKNCVQHDEDGNVRQAAVQALAQGWKDDLETLPMLKNCAQHDGNGNVRQAAVQALAQGWKDDPDTLPMLKERAQHDENGNVRQAAVQALAQGWKDSPYLFEFLCDRVLNDPYERGTNELAKYENNPRQTALEAILRNYPDHPQTLELLRDRSTNDPDEQVRKFAKKRLINLET